MSFDLQEIFIIGAMIYCLFFPYKKYIFSLMLACDLQFSKHDRLKIKCE
jgi:hypothetical protein